ncbi:hypothetical protein ASZ90_000209 [hydrocarbon metagenome]|uniref:Uncharacterized protein n=1 Tax=hydrocarbon metagenome TaxID=938273 RepID=A0A0W8G9T7_9ZZZZ
MVKSYLSRLMMLDEKFYKIEGMEGRAVSGSPKIKKLVCAWGQPC